MDVHSHIIGSVQVDATAACDEKLPPTSNANTDGGLMARLDTKTVGMSVQLECQRSSGVEQRFRKPPVVGSNPTAGWRWYEQVR